MSDDQKPGLSVNLADQVAIVTGASQGIGKATAIALGRSGARVACVARNAEKLAEAVAEIEAAGGQAAAFSCDVTDRESVDKVVDGIVEDWGRVDILVNNAGITKDTLLPRMSDEEWDAVIDTNLRGMFLFARAASRYMMRARYGRIINMASVSGLMGNPGQTNYSASKAGMIGMSKALAQEVASRGITVNCVAPGFIVTAMTEVLPDEQKEKLVSAIPSGRLGSPEDVAAGVVFLASDEAAYVTGQTLHVNGGMAMI